MILEENMRNSVILSIILTVNLLMIIACKDPIINSEPVVITITQNSKEVVAGMENPHRFIANVTPTGSSIVWSIEPSTEGISINPINGEFNVTDNVVSGTFYIKASSADNPNTHSIGTVNVIGTTEIFPNNWIQDTFISANQVLWYRLITTSAGASIFVDDNQHIGSSFSARTIVTVYNPDGSILVSSRNNNKINNPLQIPAGLGTVFIKIQAFSSTTLGNFAIQYQINDNLFPINISISPNYKNIIAGMENPHIFTASTTPLSTNIDWSIDPITEGMFIANGELIVSDFVSSGSFNIKVYSTDDPNVNNTSTINIIGSTVLYPKIWAENTFLNTDQVHWYRFITPITGARIYVDDNQRTGSNYTARVNVTVYNSNGDVIISSISTEKFYNFLQIPSGIDLVYIRITPFSLSTLGTYTLQYQDNSDRFPLRITVNPATLNVVAGIDSNRLFTSSVFPAGAPDAVNWTIEPDEPGVDIDNNGKLIVLSTATAGLFTIKASSTIDESLYGFANINILDVSSYLGYWSSGSDYTMSISRTTFSINYRGFTYRYSIGSNMTWTPVTNTDPVTRVNYPYGYTLMGTVSYNDSSHFGFNGANGITIFLLDNGKSLIYRMSSGAMSSNIYTR